MLVDDDNALRALLRTTFEAVDVDVDEARGPGPEPWRHEALPWMMSAKPREKDILF